MGVLALQGCVEPHRAHLEAAGARMVEVRRPEDFTGLSGLILPGGESTAIWKLVRSLELEAPLREALGRVAYWGICAGAILLAKRVGGEPSRLGLLDMEVERNAYGRQQESFHDKIGDYPVAYIRAPRIRSAERMEVIASRGSEAVWVEQGRGMATTFHPELSDRRPSPMHRRFLALCSQG